MTRDEFLMRAAQRHILLRNFPGQVGDASEMNDIVKEAEARAKMIVGDPLEPIVSEPVTIDNAHVKVNEDLDKISKDLDDLLASL